MPKKNVTLTYGLNSAAYSMGYVILCSFSSVYLLSIGLTNRAIGLLLGLGGIIAVVLEPIVGALIDKSKKISTRKVLMFMSLLTIIVAVLLILLSQTGVWVKTVLFGFAITFLYLAQPFLNALGTDAINMKYPINFGVGRAMGSMGYAAGSYFFGKLSVKYGPKCVPIIALLVFMLLMVFLQIYPVNKTKASIQEKPAKENPYLFLLKYKRFAVILCGLILIYFSHMLINTFALQIVLTKNGTSADMGTASAIAAVCELITTLLFSFYMSKIKLYRLLKISGIFFILKTLFSLLVKTVPQFFLIQGFQMFGWGFLSVGIVLYVNDLVKDNDKATGQAYAGMAMTIGSVLGTFLGGSIIDFYGVNAMLIVGTIAATLGSVILWLSVNEQKKNDNKSEVTK